MKIGIPKEILDSEYRVSLTPDSCLQLIQAGNQVFLEASAGLDSGFPDNMYQAAGVQVLASIEEIYAISELIVKVKQPLPIDLQFLRSDHLLFTFLHLAADKVLAQQLCAIGLTGYAYETIEACDKTLPALLPMSEIAGRMSVQLGAHFLEKTQGGNGVLLGGVPGVPKGKVVIIGGGVAGTQAAKQAIGFGAQVTIFEKNPARIRELDFLFGDRALVLDSNCILIAEHSLEADLVIGAVLIPGQKPPILLAEETVQKMKNGSVLLDIAIDQGGCIETMKPTKHSKPVYKQYGVLHYGVTNIPALVPRTATQALNNAILPYVHQISQQAIKGKNLDGGLNVFEGQIVHAEVKKAVLG